MAAISRIGAGRTKEEVAKFSRKDADTLDRYAERLEVIADVFRELVLETPPNVAEGGWRVALPEMLHAASIGGRFSKLDLATRQELLTLFAASAGDYLDGWFESDPIKAVYGFDGIVGNFNSPYAPGSAYVLLHHVFGEVNGKKGVWAHAIGGMGAITQAMAKCAASRGADIRVNAGVREIIIENGAAVGAVTESGEQFRASAVVSNLNPKLLYLKLMDQGVLPPAFRQRMNQWRCGSGTFRMNVALSELPDFTCLPGKQRAPHHTAGIIIAPTLAYMERAYFDARLQGWSKQPIVEVLIPSTLDDSLAPQGQHVASLFCQHVAPQLPNGQSWDDASRNRRGSHDRDRQQLRAELQSLGARPADQQPARSRADVRPDRRRHLPRRAEPRSDLLGAPDAGLWQLPRPAARHIYVWLRHASRRRRDRRARPQRRARNPDRFPQEETAPRICVGQASA